MPLTIGPLAHMLKNRMVLGELNQRCASCKGEHPTIWIVPRRTKPSNPCLRWLTMLAILGRHACYTRGGDERTALYRVMKTLRRSRALRGLKQDAIALRWILFSRSRLRFAHYLRHAPVPSLHIGAYQSVIPGWLNTDLRPTSADVVYLDATTRFPASAGCFKYIFAEHIIEHIGYGEGLDMLQECRRVLAPGGVLRLSTPDLSFLLKLRQETGADQTSYLEFIRQQCLGKFEPLCSNCLSTLVVNNAFRAWGHQFIYDEATLTTSLLRAGFRDVQRQSYGRSDHRMLDGLERHGETIGNEGISRMESMVLEAIA